MFLKNIVCIFVVYFLAHVFVNAFTETLTGRVISIVDGDTVKIINMESKSANQKTIIRLAEIDTPEQNQPYGERSKKALSDLIFNKIVQIKVVTIDRYGRTVGEIFLDNQNINKEMVKAGHAWVYVKYAKDKTLFKLEKNAQENQLGLWALPESERIPPWQWRKDKRKSK